MPRRNKNPDDDQWSAARRRYEERQPSRNAARNANLRPKSGTGKGTPRQNENAAHARAEVARKKEEVRKANEALARQKADADARRARSGNKSGGGSGGGWPFGSGGGKKGGLPWE